MMSPIAVTKDTATTGRSVRDPGLSSLCGRHLLLLSLWCGLVAGPLEICALVVRKHTVDLNQFYWISRHFVWLVPLTNLIMFLIVGLGLTGLSSIWPRRGSWPGTRLVCALTLLAPFWVAFPRIYGPAGFLLALGIATRIVPALERHAAGFRRSVQISFPILALITPLLAASILGGDWIKQRAEAARPLPPAGTSNVILIVLDTVAADHLSLYGYERPTSPTLESLARRGSRFDRAQATSSWTLPSHASFFTGRWPHELSASWFTPLDATHLTLAEYVGSSGYATAGVVANTTYCGTDTGLARGFTVYKDYFFPELSALKMAVLINRPLEGLRSLDRFLRESWNLGVLRPFVRPIWGRFNADARKDAEVVRRELLEWLSSRREPDRPFFAFVNFYDAHYPYEPPSGRAPRFGGMPSNAREADLLRNWWTIDKSRLSRQEIAFVRDAYDECIAALDEQLGRLLGELKRRAILERTWLIVTSDHGESFGEQPGFFGHGTSLYQPQIHVPLVIVPPSSGPKPTRPVVSETVSLRDLPATIVDLMGLKADAPFPGTSLVSLWSASPPAAVVEPPVQSPAIAEVVPIDPVEPESAQLLDRRRAWGALAEGDRVYVRREDGPTEELFDLRTDRHQRDNRAGDPAMRPVIEQFRGIFDKMIDGPLTHERFKP